MTFTCHHSQAGSVTRRTIPSLADQLPAARLPPGGSAAGTGSVRSVVVLPHVTATRYVTPLREGGSLPGLMEADDLGTYVVKFVGAGQGRKALVAEVVSGRLARGSGLPVPDLVTVDVDPALAAGEPDQEVQELLRASAGLNLGMDYLPGALRPGPGGVRGRSRGLAGRVLWFDALVGNVDRTWRNPNLLFWHGRLYLIDHGATLTFQHSWAAAAGCAARPYDARDHVLSAARPDVAGRRRRAGPAGDRGAGAGRRGRGAGPVAGRRARLRRSGRAAGGVRRPAAARLAARPAWLPGLLAAAAAGETPGPNAGAAAPRWLGGATR